MISNSPERTGQGAYRTRRRTTSGLTTAALLAGVFGIGTTLFAVSMSAGPRRESSVSSSQATAQNYAQESSQLSPIAEIVLSNLANRNSALYDNLSEAFHTQGKVARFYDCEGTREQNLVTVVEPVNLREAPTQISKVIKELTRGELLETPIKVAIDSLYRKSPTEEWLGQIEGSNLSFAAREARNREYLVEAWVIPGKPDCRLIPTRDYTKDTPLLAK